MCAGRWSIDACLVQIMKCSVGMDVSQCDHTDLLADECTVDSYAPWNFCWIVDGQLAIMAWPQNIANLKYLVDEGIRHLVTLSPEKLPPMEQFEDKQLMWTQIPIEEFEAPTLKDIANFIGLCEQCRSRNEAIAVHCRMGRGRSGVMAACYLVKFQEYGPEKAITSVRQLRPGSIETPQQERIITRFYDTLRGTKFNDVPDIAGENYQVAAVVK